MSVNFSPRRRPPICAQLFVWLATFAFLVSLGARRQAAAELPKINIEPARVVGPFDSIDSTSTIRADKCAAIASVRWLPHTALKLSYARGEFSAEERTAFREAIERWQAALANAHLDLSFIEDGEVDPNAVPAHLQIIVRRDAAMRGDKYGRIVASARQGYIESAFILINSEVRKPKLLRKLLMHELGHAFGLRDCSDCGSGKSVMNHFTRKSFFGVSIRDSNVANKPTATDVAQVVSGYNQSAPFLANRQETQVETITADETVNVTDANAVSEVNILAAYLGGAPNAKDIAHFSASGRGLTNEGKQSFDAGLPALLQVESATMDELKSYSFHREVRIQTLDEKGRVSGEYRRASDMLLDDAGRRIEKNIVLSPTTLRGFKVTNEYVEDFSGAQLKGFELRQSPLYRFEAFGFDNVEGKAARVYRITPDLPAATATSARVLFGFVWADESTGAILKVAGLALPEQKQRFPLFETRRALVDSKYLFPSVTLADDYLVFPSRRVHVRMLITYTDYRKFGSRVTITEIDDSQP
jgi:hypothetical protein